MPMRSLKWKLLLRIIIAILVVEVMLLVVSIAYRRQQLIDAHQPNQQTVTYSALPAEDRAEIRS